ncbi:hypothetical protein F5Y10DRAFT_75408 [Nemania abortiva]|nr:hypothetical protein F5Y10DRAFT_75408 [Nemania abortiva]
MASSQGDRALTCKLPLRHNAPFLQFNSPDWSKLDIIGQTVLLAELTPRFGSFQQTCEALRLEPNEIESFLEAHFDHLTAREQGQLLLDQWVQDQAVPADGEDIPQQRPLFIHASSIEPACNFLQFLAFHEHVPAVRAWVGRYLVWPPKIDVSDFDMHRLNQLDISFPQTIQQAPRYSRYTSSLGDDARAVVALVGAWQPKADGTPDTRIAFIDVPSGTIAHGPSGPKQIMGSGRHYICWPTQSLKDNIYNDFVLSRNSTDSQEDGNNGANQAGPSDDGGYDAGDQLSTLLSLGDGHNGEASSTGHLLAHAETPMNPKGIMGFGMPDAHSIDSRRSFHSSNEPQGPPRMLPNPELEQSLKDWPGQIFQFRLPPRYTVLGPLGTILTFDPPQNERYDKEGNPHGVGGTYFIVPPHQTITRMLKHTELPANVPLRMKTTEPLVLVRNGLVLPRFVAPGVHEWSTREGHLDFYSATGCYDVLQADGSYDIIPEITMRSFEQEIPQAHQSEHEHNELGNGYDNDHVNEHNNEDGAGQDTGHSAQFEDVLNDEQDDEDEEVYENEDLYDEEGHLNLRAMMAAQNAPAIEGALQVRLMSSTTHLPDRETIHIHSHVLYSFCVRAPSKT